MPATLDPRKIAERLHQMRRLQLEIEKSYRKLSMLSAGVPKHLLTRNRDGLNAAEMSKIARNLHAKAKERIASRRSKEFRGSIEDLL
jgi:hypothetical protein